MSIEDNIAKLTTAIEQLTVALVKHSALTEEAVARVRAAPRIVEQALKADNGTGAGVVTFTAPAPEPKKAVKKEAAPTVAGLCAELVENLGVTVIPDPVAAPAPAPAPVPTISEDDLRVQIVELARPNMGDAAFKAFLGGKLSELQGAPCSISGTGKLPKIDAGHLPTLLAAINKQLGK